MSPQAAADLLTSPYAIVLLLVVVALSIWLFNVLMLRGPSHIRIPQVLSGYAAVIATMLVAGWFIDLFAADNSWTSRTILPYFAVLVMAVLGVPIIGILTMTGRGSVPWCLFTSLGIALVLMMANSAIESDLISRSVAWWFSQVTLFAAFSFVIMLAFCIGARFPWREPTL